MKYLMTYDVKLDYGLDGRRQRKRRKNRYFADKMQEYREQMLHQYERASGSAARPYRRSEAESRLLESKAMRTIGENSYSCGRIEDQILPGKSRKLDDWEKIFSQVSLPYSISLKELDGEKLQTRVFELMELRTDGSHCEFLIRDSVMNRIIGWQDLPDVDTVREYLEQHPFPKDKCCSEEKFLKQVEGAEGFIHLVVEKRETAEFMLDLIYALVCQCSNTLQGGGENGNSRI